MKILLIGATGTIGRAVREELAMNHEVITAGRNGADVFVDITIPESIKEMYETVREVDAVISATGATYFGPLQDMTPENNDISIQSKLSGQINLVILGLHHISDQGSITLTSGVTMDDPIAGGASAAMACGAIRAFVQSASVEMPRGIRINNVSPTVLEESMEKYGPYFKGFIPVSASKVVQAYRKSVEGAQTGKTYTVY